MFKQLKREIHTLSAAISSEWNWRNLRPAQNEVFPTRNVLTTETQEFMTTLGAVARGTLVIYGGALNDLATNKSPKDYDSFLLTEYHPLVAMYLIEKWAKKKNYAIVNYKRRIKLLWKRLVIQTPHGAYDLSCLHGNTSKETFVRRLADEADVGPCARSATLDSAYNSSRCVEGEEKRQLIYRALGTDRHRFRHLDRWVKYAIEKYPLREVVYQDHRDAELFSAMNARRNEFQDLHRRLTEAGNLVKGFEPYRILMPELYQQLYERANASPS